MVRQLHKTVMVATILLLMLQMVTPVWALRCLYSALESPCATIASCACPTHSLPAEQEIAGTTCCASAVSPVAEPLQEHSVFTDSCGCQIQGNLPLLPAQPVTLTPSTHSPCFMEADPVTMDIVAVDSQLQLPATSLAQRARMPRHAQIVLSVWLT